MDKTENKRIVYYDILNIISIIAVIALHHNGIVHGNPNSRGWNTSLIVECICYFAVPVFCMLSGATLMNYRSKYDTKTFFKKRFAKVLIPFIIWSAVMFIWKILVLKTMQISGIIDFFNSFFSSKQEPTYYFMFVILGIYLMMPLFSHLAEEKYRKTLWYIVITFLIINSTIVPLLKLANIEWNMNCSVQIGNYMIFVILGFLLSTEDLKIKNRIMIYFGATIGLIYRYSITYIQSKNLGIVDKTTWGYANWNSVLLAASVFIIAKRLFNDAKFMNDRLSKTIAKISSCTFGIYLIHQIIMYYEVSIISVDLSSLVWRTVGIITTYLISLLIVLMIKRIPVLNRIVP